MRISFVHRAGEHERYAPGAFDSAIGKPVRLSVQGQPSGTCDLVAAEVAADGRSVTLTYDVPEREGWMIQRMRDVRATQAPRSLGLTFPPAERAP